LSTVTGPRAAVRVTSQVTLASTRSASLSASKLRVMAHPAGTVLGGAVHSFLELLATDFLYMPVQDKKAILRAYAQQQMSDLMLLDETIPYESQNDRDAA